MNDENQRWILGVDPGREKVGLAMVDSQGRVGQRAIVTPGDVEARIQTWLHEFNVVQIALGNATESARFEALLGALLARHRFVAEIVVVDERGSTLEARPLFWELHPPRGWRRWWPRSLQTPPVPLDDLAAAVIARRLWNATLHLA